MQVDIIFLSNTIDVEQYGNTQRAIATLRLSEQHNDYNFNIIVVESNSDYASKGFWYWDCTTITPDEEFNYNRFLNHGLGYCVSDWVVVANNDVIFTENWLTNIMVFDDTHPGYGSFSPYEPKWHADKAAQSGIDGSQEFYEGYRTSYEITGWCLVIKKDTISKCNLFDERFKFWYQDNDYAKTLEHEGIKHALITDSRVYHMISQSYSTIDPKDKADMTDGQVNVFFEKWGRQ